MTQHLPPNLLVLFAPRPPAPFVQHTIITPRRPYSGLANFLDKFETAQPDPPKRIFESRKQKKLRQTKDKAEKNQKKIEEEMQKCECKTTTKYSR
jgi:hypothetical protein